MSVVFHSSSNLSGTEVNAARVPSFIWNEYVKPSLAFTVPKQVLLKDWRLGLVNLLLSIVVYVGTLINIFNQGTFLITQVPSGDPNPNIYAGTLLYEEHLANLSNGAAKMPAYCKKNGEAGFEDYGFVYDAEFNYTKLACSALSANELSTKGYRSLFINTATDTTKTLEFTKQPGKSCGDTLKSLQENKEFSEYDTFSEVLGVCRYTKKQTVLALAPENTLVNLLDHRYVAEFQLAKTVRGVNPETHVRVLGDGDDKDSYKTFPEDTKLEISVDDMLKATGIDLDKTVDENVPSNGGSSERSAFLKAQQGALGYKSGKYPRTRLTGAELTIRLKYYNHGFGPKSVRKGRLSNKVRCVAELEAAPRWTALGSQSTEYLVDSSSPHIFELNRRTQDTGNGDVVHTRMLLSKYKYGVRVNIQVLGLIGQFNYNYLLNTLVQALVFLGVINSIMTLIAQYCMGARSPIYTRAMREEVNFQKCIANFTTKMFVANEAFKSVDRNGDGSVSLAEVTDAIPRIFPEMSKRESATLAALLMSVSEKEKSATTSKKISANSIRGARLHKDDFVKIFAEIKPAWFTDVISKGAIRIEEDVMLLLGENDKDQEAGAIRDLGDVEVDVERRNRSASNASAILER